MEREGDPIDTWEKFCEYVWKEFYPPKYIEQQYKKRQQLKQWKDQSIQSYTDDFYRLMARLGIQEEEKLLVLKYVSGLSLYIQQEMYFLTVSTLADAFHYASKLEAKQKGEMSLLEQANRSNIWQEVTKRILHVREPFSAKLAKSQSSKEELS